MKEDSQGLVVKQLEDLDPNNQQVMMMGAALIGFNLFLMISIGLYWTNPYIHQYFSGKPL